MSIPYYVICECGDASALIEGRFSSVIWFDELSIFKGLGCSASESFDFDIHSENKIDLNTKDFSAWIIQIQEALSSKDPKLPSLLQIWRREELGLKSEAGYFWHEDQLFMVESIYEKLVAKALRKENVPRRLARIDYDPPVVGDRIESFRMERIPHTGGQFILKTTQFGVLFEGTPLFLEQRELATAFEQDFLQIATVVSHSTGAGHKIRVTY